MQVKSSKAKKITEQRKRSLTEALITVKQALSVKLNTTEVSRVLTNANQ